MTRSPSTFSTATSTPRARLDHHMADPDAFYETLLNAHQSLSPAESAALNARLILLLANQIGDAAVLNECIALATASG